MKCSRNLGNRRIIQSVGRQTRQASEETASPSSSQSLCHTCVVVLSDAHRIFNLFQHFRLPGVESHDRSQFGYSVDLTVVLTSCHHKDAANFLLNSGYTNGFVTGLPVSSLPASTFFRKLFKLPCLHGPSMGSCGRGPATNTFIYT